MFLCIFLTYFLNFEKNEKAYDITLLPVYLYVHPPL
jgi:hypothetical protein